MPILCYKSINPDRMGEEGVVFSRRSVRQAVFGTPSGGIFVGRVGHEKVLFVDMGHEKRAWSYCL